MSRTTRKIGYGPFRSPRYFGKIKNAVCYNCSLSEVSTVLPLIVANWKAIVTDYDDLNFA